MIYNIFRHIGFANSLNHSEDHLFNSWRRMKEEMPLIENDLVKDYQFNDNLEYSKDIMDKDED